MDFFGPFLWVAIPTVAIGIIAFIIIAIVAEAKSGGRAEAIKSSFLYVTSLVTLFMIAGSVVFMLQQTGHVVLKHSSLPYNNSVRNTPPPTFYLSSATGINPIYACTDKCEFTSTDKDQFALWKTQYADWKKNQPGNSVISRYTNDDKRQTINALSFFLVSIPLFFWFFVKQAQKENRKKDSDGLGRSHSLRSAYFYIVAFSGLLGLIISGAMLLNTVLRSSFGLSNTNTTSNGPIMAVPAGLPTSKTSTEAYGVRSVIACGDKCGFSADDTKVAQNWLLDYDAWQTNNNKAYPIVSSAQTDIANMLPILIVSLLLFLYHFITIRRENSATAMTPPAPKPSV